jgi:hypothetical protein
MKKETLTAIKLKSSQIQKISDGDAVKGYEGCYIECNTDTGDFDLEKGSMVDYDIWLYDKEGELLGVATGGYYNAICGHQFNYDLTFYPPEPETPLSKFNDFLEDLSHENAGLKKKITKIKKYLSKLEA